MFGIRRREFMTLLGGAAAVWPMAARAQQAERVRRVMVWIGGSSNDTSSQQREVTFRDTMRGLGWIDGRNSRSKSVSPPPTRSKKTAPPLPSSSLSIRMRS
jgi:hypothetical protein